MNDHRVYEALARGQSVETVLPDLLPGLGAEAAVLYFVGQAEAAVAFRHASLELLEEMRNRLMAELRSWRMADGGTGALPERVELALSEESLARLNEKAPSASIQVHAVRFGVETAGALALAHAAGPLGAGSLMAAAEGAAHEGSSDACGRERLLAALGFAYRIESTRRTGEEVQGCLERLALAGRVFAEGQMLDRALARFLEIAVDLVGANVGLMVVKTDPGEKAVSPVGWGLPPDWIQNLRFRDGHKVVEVVFAEGRPYFLDTTESLDAASAPKFLVGLAAVPLTYEGGTLGCLCVANPPRHFFEINVERRALSAVASLAASAIRNARYMESEIRAERLREEVRLAAHVQADLLPRHLPDNDEIEVAAIIRLASHLGGDFYDVLDLGEGRWGIIVADVSGKGSSGAILMAMARAYLHVFARERVTPGEVLRKMNEALARDFTEGRFLTATYVIIDLPAGRLQMAGAGHHPIFLIKPGGQVDCLPSDDLPLGITPDGRFDEITAALERGTTILFYTDGLVEASSPEGRFFGSERMLAALSAVFSNTAKEVIHHLLTEVQNWTQSATFADDLTILAARIK